MIPPRHAGLRRRSAAMLLATTIALAACGSSNGQATTTTTDTATADTANTAVPAAAISETFEAIGNPDADIVVVNAQGGPTTELSNDELRYLADFVDLETTYVVNVHQAQTIDPDGFVEADIDFAAAQRADEDSVQMLANVVDSFSQRGKTVYVVGISFGAFIAQDLIATHGVTADGYLMMVGRLDIPDSMWQVFADGGAAGFVDGVEVVEVSVEEAGMGAASAAGDRNMSRLAAGLGHKRFSDLLADIDLSSITYVYGVTDEQVGRLSSAEVAFLESRGARVISDPGGHDDAVDNHVAELLTELVDR